MSLETEIGVFLFVALGMVTAGVVVGVHIGARARPAPKKKKHAPPEPRQAPARTTIVFDL